MSKLKTFNDGSYMPLWQADLEFIQEAFSMPFVELCETLLGKTSGIINCEVTSFKNSGGTVTQISEGLLLMEGEIVYCPAQSIFGPDAVALVKEEAYDNAGDKVFKVDNGTDVRQTYYTPKAVLAENTFSGGVVIEDPPVFLTLDSEGSKTLIECLYDALFAKCLTDAVFQQNLYNLLSQKCLNDTPFLTNLLNKLLALPYSLEGNGPTVNVPGVGWTTGIRFAKIGKRVHVLYLDLANHDPDMGTPPSKPAGSEIYDLGNAYKPFDDVYFVCREKNTTGTMFFGRVKTDGKICIESNSTGMIAAAFSYLVP